MPPFTHEIRQSAPYRDRSACSPDFLLPDSLV
jgi:hypothetical protein